MNIIDRRCALHWLLVTVLIGFGSMAHSVEEPEHAVIGEIGKVEIRYYEPVVQAVTTLSDSGQSSAGFRRLAGFIFGGNDSAQKIAMTAPVQETLGPDGTEMAFTMPGKYSMQSLPAPNDPSVALIEVPARTVAIIGFSGWATADKVERYSQQLVQSLEAHGIEIASAPMLNQYNPPWTPPFLRRNEIMLEISLPAQALPVQADSGKLSSQQDGDVRYKF